jgi:outer membrane receptor protein involved in Fe transport
VRGEWSINSNAMVRGTFGTAVRAPNLYELYAPRTAAIANVADPCDRISDSGAALPPLSANRQQNCDAVLGAAAALLDQTQVQRQTVGNVSEGNPSLEAESAETFTLGVVLKSPGVDGLSVTADYFEIAIDDVISRLTIQNIVNECYDTAGLPGIFCDQVSRDPVSGQLLSVNNAYLNAATERLSGVDVALDYALDLNRISAAIPGALTLRATWSHLLEHEFEQTANSPVDDRTGQVGDFDDRIGARIAYEIGDIELSWDTRYLSSALADTSQSLGPRNRIDAFWYHDAQVYFRFGDGRYGVRAGAKNLFDKQPPIITPPARTSPDGYATAAGVYDTRGRFFYLSATANF